MHRINLAPAENEITRHVRVCGDCLTNSGLKPGNIYAAQNGFVKLVRCGYREACKNCKQRWTTWEPPFRVYDGEGNEVI